ncbi:MAG: transporter substrate-binding domain-containing protein [Ruminococcaceae bacterium]|nr:transporter substrate-binding domain-containing protein [Oscillospiraceae bacterium]
MKKLFTVILAGLMLSGAAFGFTGCANNAEDETQSNTNTLAVDTASLGLMADNTLTIGMEIGYPPFEYYAEDGVTPIGFDVDMVNAIADKLGLEVNFINTAWDVIFAGIGMNYDVVVSGVTITEERKETMAFSTPYINNYQCVVVPTGSDLKVEDFLMLESLSVSVMKGTASDIMVTDLIDTGSVSCTVKRNEQVPTCFTELANGEVDVVVCDSTVADSYVAKNPEKYTIAYRDETAPEQFGIAMGKDNAALLDAINQAIAALEEDGFFEANTTKWFG